MLPVLLLQLPASISVVNQQQPRNLYCRNVWHMLPVRWRVSRISNPCFAGALVVHANIISAVVFLQVPALISIICQLTARYLY